MDNKNSNLKAMAVGFAAGTLTAMLLSHKSCRNAGKWANEMRDEVANRVKETKDITQEKYNQIIDEIRPRYESMKDVSVHEMSVFISELKSHWQNISKEAKSQMDIANQNREQKKSTTEEK